jgi:aminocarboxymuconate-semialdehyde decarboxylase
MFKIDIHTHIIPEHLPNFKEKYGYGGFISLDHHKPCCARMMIDDRFFREIQDNCWSAETRIKECDHHHIDMQVLSTIPVMFSYWAPPADALDLSMFLNDHIASIVHTPIRKDSSVWELFLCRHRIWLSKNWSDA